jgi:ATP-dependent helicase/DNAse subunit B
MANQPDETVAGTKRLGQTWSRAVAGAQLMSVRWAWRSPGPYEGFLQEEAALAVIQRRFPPNAAWSVSRLNRYGRCPIGFFVEHVMGLEPRPDPVIGLDARQWGSLVHAVLERFYASIATAPGRRLRDLDEPDSDRMLAEACDAVFRDAPRRYGFRPGALWRHERVELQRTLSDLIAWERADMRFRRFAPDRQEQRFGLDSRFPALVLADAAGVPYRIHGIIDRVDRSTAGLRIIDYKSGSTRYTEGDIDAGLALQSSLYPLALDRGSPDRVVDSFYIHIPLRAVSGEIVFEGPVADNPHVTAAVAKSGEFVAAARSGRFPAAPAKPHSGATGCTEDCPFKSVCRVTRRGIWKARHLSA